MRTLAIGDIHGCLKALEALLSEVKPEPDDLIVTLGDYVGRGPDTKGVLDRLIELRQRHECVNLLGNHDVMMLKSRDDLVAFQDWLRIGGKQVLKSYSVSENFDAFPAAIPESHWNFLEKTCVPYYETETHFFVHANAYPDMEISEQPDYMLFWEKLEPQAWRPHESRKTMICGHTSQRSGRPLVLKRAVCIDTRAYEDGWLTCLDVNSKIYWQANQRGETRLGNLEFQSR